MSTVRVRVSILAPYEPNKPDDKAYLGKISRTNDPPGELAFSELVSEPTKTVALLTNDETWPEREPGIVAELAGAPDKQSRDAIKKRIPAIVPARFMGNRRVSEECLGRQVVGHDFDAVVAETFEEACAKIRAQLPDRFVAVHTTATERNPGDADGRPKGSWCLRAYEILDREATPAEWDARVKGHMRSLGEHDSNALDVTRLLFCPVRTAGYRFQVYEGPRTRLDDLTADAAPAARPTPAPVPVAVPREGELLSDADRRAARLLAGALPPPCGSPSRREIKFALGGAFAHEGRPEEYATAFRRDVWSHLGPVGSPNNPDDGEGTDKESPERTTYRRFAEGKHITGWTRLAELLGAAGLVDDVRKLRDVDAAAKARVAEKSAELTAREAAEAVATAPDDPHHVAIDGFVFRKGGWDEPLARPTYVVEGLIVQGSTTLFVAHGNSLKSMTSISICAAIARGAPWLGRFPTLKGPAVIADYERSPYEARRRVKLLRVADGLSDFMHCANPPFAADDPRFWETMCKLGPRFLTVDSLSAGRAGDESENETSAANGLKLAKKFSNVTEGTSLFIHHKRKGSGGDARESVRGSTAIFAAVDAVFEFIPIEAPEGIKRMRVVCTKFNLGPEPAPFAVELTDERGLVFFEEPSEPVEEPSTEAKVREEALQILREPGHTAGIKKTNLEKRLHGRNEARRRVIAKLESDGVTVEFRNGRAEFVMLNPNRYVTP